MEFNADFNAVLVDLNERWEYIFSVEIEDWAFAETSLDSELFSDLIYDTARALDAALPERTAAPLYCWEATMGLFGYLKAFSVFPTVVGDFASVGFDAAKTVAKRLIERYADAAEHFAPWDVFEDFDVPFDCLPDSYEKDPNGIAFIPYSLEDGDLSALEQALRDGGIYAE